MNTARIKTPPDWQGMNKDDQLNYLADTLRNMAFALEYGKAYIRPELNPNGNTMAIKIKVKS